ncbi:MAG TPA: hypothetical protein VFC61_01910 [Blastocatellia bacterium]|nr:hypothetical protein [Blastocatellia bacterium]
MSLPEVARVEVPILLELKATGGRDQLRYLYERLVRYFPQLTAEDLGGRTGAGRSRWHRVVQSAGRELEGRGELRRAREAWELTPRGLRRAEAEILEPEAAPAPAGHAARALTHREAQAMLVEIGRLLGRHAAAEFEYYDVVWRESAAAPRLSHVFEVQISGSVDSALTRLKHAYDAQRSRPFLVVADERDERFAGRRLSGSFHEIWDVITVIGTGELARLYEALRDHADLLAKITARD